MNGSLMLSLSTLVYGFSSLLYIMGLIFKKEKLAILGRYVIFFGFVIITLGIIFRWRESYNMGIGHIPLANLYESLIFFSWVLIMLYILFERKYKNIFLGTIVIPIAFFSLAYASLSPNINQGIEPLLPALQSNWLTIHVVTCFFGYAAFSISFGLSVVYILKVKLVFKIFDFLNKLPDIYVLDELNYRMVIFGFLFLSIGIITGSVWANSAWGSYWSWDPKETWSLITWFIYAILIHVKLMGYWGSKRLAYISMLGFISMLFTYFGVNYLHGLHSYALG